MPATLNIIRRRLDLRGQVQGVGFRPCVYRLARSCGLTGFVSNNGIGAAVEVEGPTDDVKRFEAEMTAGLPPLARISETTRRDLPPTGAATFDIRPSESDADTRPEVTPDVAVCPDCLREMFDPHDRRFRYPFINCTNCGPRYSIIRAVPYDRPNTTMAAFDMCPACRAEYADPADRRFHAQPIACPACGPALRLCRTDRSELPGDPVVQAARLLREGRVVAIKGIGGYHLACRADDEGVVTRLRQRKLRDGKPLAVMAADLAAVRRIVELTDAGAEVLASPAAPILLAPKMRGNGLAASVAPDCEDFGVMLPYAPLHHLLFAEGLGPLVMTSANLSGEPLTYGDDDAFDQLADVADAFLTHNRAIHRPVDDSIVFMYRDRAVPVRRARGYAPQAIIGSDGATKRRSDGEKGRRDRGTEGPRCGRRILAVGGELKSTVCLYDGRQAILSEHLGDLKSPRSYRNFLRAVDRLKSLFAFEPDVIACDLHPQYLSTVYARRMGLPAVGVQHHHAHVASVMAEHGRREPVIGLACDGTGYGDDGAIWGCEILRCDARGYERIGHLAYFPLVGGDEAAVETWRPAAALLRQALGADWPGAMPPPWAAANGPAIRVFESQIAARLNAPPCSSLGRVFDAAAFLLGLCDVNRHEAQAAMALQEAAARAKGAADPYGFEISEPSHDLKGVPEPRALACTSAEAPSHDRQGVLPPTYDRQGVLVPNGRTFSISLSRAFIEMMDDLARGANVTTVAARFHETIAHALVESARTACDLTGLHTVALSGGCFYNRRLLERVSELLTSSGLEVLTHHRVPPGDGGLALGQAVTAECRVLRAEC